MLVLLGGAHFAPARAAEPARCTRAAVTKSRRSAEKLYRDGKYAEAVAALRAVKASCWSALEATDRGWLVSDLGLAALRAGQPELCRQVLDEAPAELDPQSRVGKALAHNRGLCQGDDGGFAVQVFFQGIWISSPAEAAATLTEEWDEDSFFSAFTLREGSLPHRRDRVIDRCTETEGVRLAELDVRTTLEIYPAQGQLIRCWALKKVTGARPSRVSHVRDLLSSKALGKVLPEEVAPLDLHGPVDTVRASSGNRTWSDLDPTVRFEPAENKGEIRVSGDGEAGSLSWWALGDFNGDGFEDVLIERSMSPEGGSLTDMDAFLLTRTQPGGVLKILERME